MIGIKELLVVTANTHHETPVRVSVAGELLNVRSVEVRHGTLVIEAYDAPKAKDAADTAAKVPPVAKPKPAPVPEPAKPEATTAPNAIAGGSSAAPAETTLE